MRNPPTRTATTRMSMCMLVGRITLSTGRRQDALSRKGEDLGSGIRIDLLLQSPHPARFCFHVSIRRIRCIQPTNDRWVTVQAPPKLLDTYPTPLPSQI